MPAVLKALCLAFVFATATVSARAGGVDARLDPVVRTAMANWQVPGLAVAIVRAGAPALVRTYGVRDVAQGAPVTRDTVFALGSITKTITALGLAVLADEGRIAWDEPVRRYMPTLRFHDPKMSEIVTLRDLMSHRTGMARHDALWYFGVFGREALIEKLRHLPASAPLGAVYQYNNLMVMVAGAAAGRVADASWEEFTTNRLLRPLGMTATRLSAAGFRALPDRATGYFPARTGRERIPLRDTDAIAPAAAAYAPITDTAKLLHLLVHDGTIGNGARMISEEALAELHRPAMIRPDTSRAEEFNVTGYGIGLYAGSFRDEPIYWHWGTIDGYGGMLSFRPESGVGVAVLTNLSGHNPVPTLVTLAAYDAMDGRDPARWVDRYGARPPPVNDPPYVCPEADESAPPLSDYSGIYEHPAYGRVEIVREGEDTLALRMHGVATGLDGCGGDAWLVRETDWPVREGLIVRFRRDASGKIVAMEAPIADGPTYRLNPGPLTFRHIGTK